MHSSPTLSVTQSETEIEIRLSSGLLSTQLFTTNSVFDYKQTAPVTLVANRMNPKGS